MQMHDFVFVRRLCLRYDFVRRVSSASWALTADTLNSFSPIIERAGSDDWKKFRYVFSISNRVGTLYS
jgi:hypothetical protein